MKKWRTHNLHPARVPWMKVMGQNCTFILFISFIFWQQYTCNFYLLFSHSTIGFQYLAWPSSSQYLCVVMFNRKDNKESDKELRLLAFVYMQLSKGCALQLSLFDASAWLWSSSGTSWASILCCTVVPSLCSDVHTLLNHANHILPT
jgi:hypothetical protein